MIKGCWSLTLALLHVVNVVNKGGQVYFIDSQIGKIVTLRSDLTLELGVR